MNKIIKVAAPLILIGTGAACLYKKCHPTTNTFNGGNIVIIPGNDPAFDPTMYNVLLVKRINSDHRLAVVKTIRLYTNCDLGSIKDLTDHGGYICGLRDDQMLRLKADLEDLEAVVEIK